MSEPRITVIMPVKNYHPGYLRDAIASVTTQSAPAWQLVVVVEPGDVETFRTLLARDLEDPRIEVIANRGRKLAGAVNSGMRHARTEFVALLLADDMWSKDAVQVLREYIATYPNADFLHSSRLIIDEKGAAISPVYASRPSFQLEEFRRGSPVKHLLCWRREKGLAVGGLDESLNSVGPDDYDFPWTMAANGARFQAVSECLYYYRNHCECYRLTTHLPRSVHGREVDRILKKHGVGVWERLRLRVARRRGAVGEQCLYRSPLDRWIKDTLGYDARRGWRQIRYR